jgi:hypothetical protein
MQNFSGKIGKNYKGTTRLLILIVIIVVSAGSIWLFNSSSGKEAHKETYTLSKDSEGVKKTNKLLADLLLIEDTTVREIRTVNDLNRRYKALTFNLPFADDIEFGSSSFVHTSDIRLTDIDPSKITDEKDRDHFYNSNLQSLLEKQRSDNSINFFRIKFKKEGGQIRIREIKLITSLFRVHLDKKNWTGSIVATDYGLFPENEFCFLSWGQNILPIKQCSVSGRARYFTADLSRHEFFKSNTTPLSMVDLSMNDYNSSIREIGIFIDDNRERIGTVTFKYIDSTTVIVKSDNQLRCVLYAIGDGPSYINPTSAGGNYDTVNFSRDLKIAFYDRANRKVAEMMLSHKNPFFTMSSPVRNNQGFGRYTIDAGLTDRFTQQVVRGVSNMLADNEIDSTVQLTLDPYLSKWLEEEIQQYVGFLRISFINGQIGRPDDRWEMSVTVIDMRTGAIIAMPYYRSEDEKLPFEVALSRKNPALTRRYIGSTFKPLLTLAAVQTEPNLINLNTVNNRMYGLNLNSTERNAEMFGFPVKYWGSVSHWNGRNSIESFLAASCDVYPVAMTILALNENRYPRPNGNSGIFTARGGAGYLGYFSERESGRFHWNNLELMRNLSILYDINSYSESENEDDASYKMERYIWRNIPSWDILDEDQTHSVDIVSPDLTVMHYESFDELPYTVSSNIRPWVLGQGSNTWSCIKLAEAWSRMLTKRKIKACITTPQNIEPEIITIPTDRNINRNALWNEFLDKLYDAQSQSADLLTPMYNAVNALNNEMQRTGDEELMLFSKTGTPENYDWQEYLTIRNTKLRYDVGLYCMGLMTRGAYNFVKDESIGGARDGIMCVIRITRITTDKRKQDGLWSHHARDFFSRDSQRLREFYWLTKKHFGR